MDRCVCAGVSSAYVILYLSCMVDMILVIIMDPFVIIIMENMWYNCYINQYNIMMHCFDIFEVGIYLNYEVRHIVGVDLVRKVRSDVCGEVESDDMDKLDYKLDVKLVPWMEEMFVMMSKVELCEDWDIVGWFADINVGAGVFRCFGGEVNI